MAAVARGEDMKKRKMKERASTYFGRPSINTLQKNLDAKLKDEQEKKKTQSCWEGCFAMLVGPAPDLSNTGMTSYALPEELQPLPPYRKWAELPDSLRGGVKCEAVSVAKEEVPGWTNQDATLACCTSRPESAGAPDTLPLLFGVFDGHGRDGHEVSAAVADRMAGHLAEHEEVLLNPAENLKAAVAATDSDVYKALGSRIEYSGSTGVTVLFDRVQQVLHIANVGDSRAIVGQYLPDAKSPRWDAVALTMDCKPDDPEERERIEINGGFVSQLREDDGTLVGPVRVWETAAMHKPGLATSRTFGDGCGRSVGVISTPVVTSHRLKPEDRILLIASDGLWDSIGNEEAVRIVGKFINIPQVALKALVEAVRRAEGNRLVDDTSVVLVVLK